MRLEVTPDEPWHVRVRYNGAIIFDKTLEAGKHHDVDVEHPKTCGKAEMCIVDDEDGSEFPIGEKDYGACSCTAGTAPEACSKK